GACVPTLDNNGISDLGDVSVDQITGKSFQKEASGVNVTITCGAPTKMGVWITDNRNDTAVSGLTGFTDRSMLGLGQTAAGDNIGAYVVYLENWVIDGVAGQGISAPEDNQTSWEILDGGVPYVSNRGTPDIATGALKGTLTPLAFTVMTFRINPVVNLSTDVKSITDVTNIDGNATLSFEYL
uniref:DUF1120 domain-containing protein n=1 Tax=Serratia marcescens TaxID=615 RepID=UPI0011E886E3